MRVLALAAVAALISVSPVLAADEPLTPARIVGAGPNSGDVLLGSLKLGRRQGGVFSVTAPVVGSIDGATVGGATIPSVLAGKAPIASPMFSGTVTAPAINLTGGGLFGPADNSTTAALGAGMIPRSSAARAADRITLSDASSSACSGATDATAALNAAAAAAAAGSGALVINCPANLSRPDLVSIPANVHLAFEGRGSLTWNFGTLTSVYMASPGAAYTGVPTASITGNATLGPVTMGLYLPTLVSGGTGYVVGDVLTLNAGTGTKPTLRVEAVSGGVITAVSARTAGALTALTSGTLTTSGGSGTGATVTANYTVVSVGVSNGGSYPSGAVPEITLTGGNPQIPAAALAIGRKLAVPGNITAPERQVFGGYARLSVAPNSGSLRAAWFGATSYAPDPETNRAAIQAATDSGILVKFGIGFYNTAGTLYVYGNTKWIADVATASADGGFAQYGTQVMGVTSGSAFVKGYPGAFAGGIAVDGIVLSTDGASSYPWTVDIPNMASSEWTRFGVQNNSASSASGGGARFGSEATTTAITGVGYPRWVNHVTNGKFGSRFGAAINNETTDSRFTNLYISGGNGSIEGGLNNNWSDVMIDNVNGVCITVRPSIVGASSYFNWTSGNFQHCTVAEMAFRPAIGSSGPVAHYANVTGANFNNSSPSTADVILDNAQRVTFSGNAFSTNATAHFSSIGATDYITVVGNDLPRGLSGVMGTHSFVINNDGKIGGTANLKFLTSSGNAFQITDVPGQNVPVEYKAGVGGVSPPKFLSYGGVGMALDSDNTIKIQQNGSSILDFFSGGVASYKAYIDLSTVSTSANSGQVLTMSNGTGVLDLTLGGAIAALTVKLPPSPLSGQYFDLGTNAAITTLTVQDAGGSQVASWSPGALSANGAIRFQYTGSTWKRRIYQ